MLYTLKLQNPTGKKYIFWTEGKQQAYVRHKDFASHLLAKTFEG